MENNLNKYIDNLNIRYLGKKTLPLLKCLIKGEFLGNITLVSSFGSESAILLHLVAQVNPDLKLHLLIRGFCLGKHDGIATVW